MRAFVFSPFFLLSACAVVAGYRLKLFFYTGFTDLCSQKRKPLTKWRADLRKGTLKIQPASTNRKEH